MKTRRTCTKNEAGERAMRLSAVICTANVAAIADGEWALIAPYGDHPSPDGSYVQRFSRDQAESVVRSWNSITGRAARLFKNLFHGLGTKTSLPAWDGHPETDARRWPVEKLLAEITELRTGNEGLEGRVFWTHNQASSGRTRGPLFPSALWWHWPPAGEPPAVFPELLESIGLVPTPNISSVPAWTANATLSGEPQPEPEPKDPMNEQQLKALRAALGLAETANAEECIATANAIRGTQLVSAQADLTTANAARDKATADLATANAELTAERGKVTAIASERDTLKTANASLAAGILDVAEKRGIITPAERTDFATRITANAAPVLEELKTRKPAVNTASIEINGSRVDLSTANSRMSAYETAVQSRMAADKCDRDTAVDRCHKDPNLKPLFDAMNAGQKAA